MNNRQDFIIIAIILALGIIGTEFMANQIGYTYFGFEQPKAEIQNHRTLD
jgi:hypothetical protein